MTGGTPSWRNGNPDMKSGGSWSHEATPQIIAVLKPMVLGYTPFQPQTSVCQGCLPADHFVQICVYIYIYTYLIRSIHIHIWSDLLYIHIYIYTYVCMYILYSINKPVRRTWTPHLNSRPAAEDFIVKLRPRCVSKKEIKTSSFDSENVDLMGFYGDNGMYGASSGIQYDSMGIYLVN